MGFAYSGLHTYIHSCGSHFSFAASSPPASVAAADSTSLLPVIVRLLNDQTGYLTTPSWPRSAHSPSACFCYRLVCRHHPSCCWLIKQNIVRKPCVASCTLPLAILSQRSNTVVNRYFAKTMRDIWRIFSRVPRAMYPPSAIAE